MWDGVVVVVCVCVGGGGGSFRRLLLNSDRLELKGGYIWLSLKSHGLMSTPFGEPLVSLSLNTGSGTSGMRSEASSSSIQRVRCLVQDEYSTVAITPCNSTAWVHTILHIIICINVPPEHK